MNWSSSIFSLHLRHPKTVRCVLTHTETLHPLHRTRTAPRSPHNEHHLLEDEQRTLENLFRLGILTDEYAASSVDGTIYGGSRRCSLFLYTSVSGTARIAAFPAFVRIFRCPISVRLTTLWLAGYSHGFVWCEHTSLDPLPI